MIKGFRQIASLTAFSRVLGMLRDMTFAYFLGAGALMDSWVFAFIIPNLARRLFGEGAVASSLVPVYIKQLHEDPQKAKRLALTVLTVVCIILAAIVLIAELAIFGYHKLFTIYDTTNLRLSLAAIMLPYMILICAVAILAAVLNAHRHFAAPAAAPIVLNIFIIASLCFTGWVLKIPPRTQVFFVAIAVLFAGISQVLIQLPPLRANGLLLRPAWDIRSQPFRNVTTLMAPMIIGLTATQLNTLADVLVATGFSGSAEKGYHFSVLGSKIAYPLWQGAVSQLFYSQRLYQFPLGVLGISLATAIFPLMSSDAARNDSAALCNTVARGLRSIVFIAVPATAGLIIVARPLVSAIFERGRFTSADTILTTRVLWFYALGLSGFFAQQILTRAFYSMQDSKVPARSAVTAVCANLILNLTLIWFMATAGLALSTAICSYLQVTIMAVALRKRLGPRLFAGLPLTFAKTLVATLFCSLAAAIPLYLCRNLPTTTRFDILRLALAVPAATLIYLLAAKLLSIPALALLTGRKNK